MLRTVRRIGVLLVALMAAGCRPDGITTDATQLADTNAPDACQVIGGGEGAMVYTRPSVQADVFAPLSAAEFPIALGAKTADGWLGFEPGVAQAANIGVFRLRWVLAAEVQVSGECQTLPEVVGPPPGVCFMMPMEDVAVYVQPNGAAEVVATLTVGQYAAVNEINAGWAKLDLGAGNSGLERSGWVREGALNVNGPCEGLFAEGMTQKP